MPGPPRSPPSGSTPSSPRTRRSTRASRLAIEKIEIANIETLKVTAFIVLYAHAQAEAAGALQTDAKVPASLVQEGIELEARMQELCEYKFKRETRNRPPAPAPPGPGRVIAISGNVSATRTSTR